MVLAVLLVVLLASPTAATVPCREHLVWPADWHLGDRELMLCMVEDPAMLSQTRVVSRQNGSLALPRYLGLGNDINLDHVEQLGHAHLGQQELEGQPPPSAWAEPRESVIVSLSNGCVAGPNGVVFDTSYVITNRRWHRKTLPTSRPSQRTDHAHVASLVIVYGQHFQHFMLETLPRLALDPTLLTEGGPTLLVNPGMPAQFLQHVLGVAADRIVEADADTLYCATRLDFPTFTRQEKMGLVPVNVFRPLLPRLRAYARAAASQRDPSADAHVISRGGVVNRTILYLLRAAGSSRSVERTHEARLLDIVAKHLSAGVGLDVWRPDDPHGYREDAPRFLRARAVLGPHGGAFANLPFADADTHVIEFISRESSHPSAHGGGDVRPCYWGMAQGLGLPYWQLHPKHFGFDDPNMGVDGEDVLSLLSALGLVHRDSVAEMRRHTQTRTSP